MGDYIQEMRKHIGSKPLILVGATILVQNNQEEILMQLRSDTKEWGLPGGAMEMGESLLDTAKRELFEETGLMATSYEQIDILSGKDLYYRYPNGDEVYNVIVLYKAQGVKGELTINDDEGLELRYFSIQNLPQLIDERAKIIINHYVL